MAQNEDTELRDLVIEALEKNGSLAKIRALLRANVFLVFEDEGQNLKQNVSLDNILKLPEGALCLSIIHEFLEFCNLKNTLFVYMAESRQGTDYDYEGKENLTSKLKFSNRDNSKEPLLLTLLKLTRLFSQRKYFDQGDGGNLKTEERSNNNNLKDDQNCTYIVHEDSNSSGTSNSQSDNSSDEKNKLHLRLQLDNSDTDTSSDSTRDKSSSEYIANEHIITESIKEKGKGTKSASIPTSAKHEKQPKMFGDSITNRNNFHELKLINTNSSSDSTSYIDLKPYNPLDQKLLNTTGIPILEDDEKQVSSACNSEHMPPTLLQENTPQGSAAKIESVSETLSSTSLKNEEIESKPRPLKPALEDSTKSDAETIDYSNDFTSSPVDKNKNVMEKPSHSPVSGNGDENIRFKNTSFESPRQSSQSSVSISDIADLISEKSSSFGQNDDKNFSDHKYSDKSKKASNNDKSDNSTQFSESPIPSLSNLSLDVHSD